MGERPTVEELEKKIERLERINRALMDRVERGMNLDEGAFCLFQAATALEGEVRERTSALQATLAELKGSNEELKVARDSADAANRAKSQFLANMSHEIRTPMNGVLGMLELVLASEMTRPQRRMLMTVRRSAETLLDLINEILDYSRIEAGKLEVECIDFDLRSVIEDSVDALAERAQRKGVEIICHVSPGLRTSYRGDPLRTRQVLMNLLGNATKFTSTGEIVVRVAETQGPSGNLVRVSVRDSGIGIPEKALPVIFDPFRQADGTTTRIYEGSGLGLAIAKKLVTLMGGSIGVESTVGMGSTFWFELPLPANDRALPAPPPFRKVLRVLLVDDSDSVAAMVRDYAEAWGVKLDVVKSARAALAVVFDSGRKPYDLVLLDASVSDAEKIQKAIPKRLVLLTDARQELREERSASSVMTKPLRPTALRRLLNELVEHERVRAESAMYLPAIGAAQPMQARVLLVEDNAVNQEVARGFLEALGCSVKVADNGMDAVESWQSGTFDLVLMDWHMPGMDGLEATAEIRRREAELKRGAVPIVALTASAMMGDRERCLAAKMDDFLTKPFSVSALRSVVERWVAKPAPVPVNVLTEPDVIEVSVLEELGKLTRPGGPDFVENIVKTYLDHSAMSVQALVEAHKQGDARAVKGICHKMKSSSAAVGAMGLSRLVAEAERQSDGDAGVIRDLVLRIASESASADQSLAAFLERRIAARAGEGASATSTATRRTGT